MCDDGIYLLLFCTLMQKGKKITKVLTSFSLNIYDRCILICTDLRITGTNKWKINKLFSGSSIQNCLDDLGCDRMHDRNVLLIAFDCTITSNLPFEQFSEIGKLRNTYWCFNLRSIDLWTMGLIIYRSSVEFFCNWELKQDRFSIW